MSAKRSGERRIVRPLQTGSADPIRVMAFLVHAYGSIHAVVDYQHDERGAIFRRRGQFLRIHQEAAVAGNAHYAAVSVTQGGSDSGRQAVDRKSTRLNSSH